MKIPLLLNHEYDKKLGDATFELFPIGLLNSLDFKLEAGFVRNGDKIQLLEISLIPYDDSRRRKKSIPTSQR